MPPRMRSKRSYCHEYLHSQYHPDYVSPVHRHWTLSSESQYPALSGYLWDVDTGKAVMSKEEKAVSGNHPLSAPVLHITEEGTPRLEFDIVDGPYKGGKVGIRLFDYDGSMVGIYLPEVPQHA